MKMEKPLTDATAASPDIGGACTTILAIGKAAKDGETLSGQVEELFSMTPRFAVGKTNRTAIFHELVTAIGYNLSYADKVQQFWEAFEFQTLREMFYPWGGVLAEAKTSMKAGDRGKAEDLLYEFTSKKCELALTYAAELTEKVKSDCLVELK